jgi:hypothetical protein
VVQLHAAVGLSDLVKFLTGFEVRFVWRIHMSDKVARCLATRGCSEKQIRVSEDIPSSCQFTCVRNVQKHCNLK